MREANIMGRSVRAWTESELERAYALARSGMTYREIAGKLGRTYAAVCNKLSLSDVNAEPEAPDSAHRRQDVSEDDVATFARAANPVGVQIASKFEETDDWSPGDAWETMARKCRRRIKKYQEQRIFRARFSGAGPVAIVAVSDQHIGGKATDMDRMLEDAKLIRDTPGFYAVLAGDGVDNHIKHRAAMIDADSEPELQFRLYEYYLQILAEKLLVVVSGNHDAWTKAVGGMDMVRQIATNNRFCYTPDEARITCDVGGQEYVVAMRHKFRFGSAFNQTHTVKRFYERGVDTFDIGIIGHHHEHAMESCIIHSQKRYVCRPGSYQILTGYSAAEGFADAIPTCPTFVLHPGSRRITAFDDIREAIWACNGKVMG